MNTKSLNISFPEDLKTKAKQLAVEQKHGSVGRYIQYLLRREAEKDTERKKLKVLLQQGIDSRTSDTTPEEFFKQLRSNLK